MIAIRTQSYCLLERVRSQFGSPSKAFTARLFMTAYLTAGMHWDGEKQSRPPRRKRRTWCSLNQFLVGRRHL
jgi:hypothetical protein